MDWIAHVTEALNSMYRGASKLPDEVLAVEGYSSPLGTALLNVVCAGLDAPCCRVGYARLPLGWRHPSVGKAHTTMAPGAGRSIGP